MRFRVPKRIKLHGKTGRTRLVETVDDDDSLGEYHEKVIKLKRDISNKEMEWAFWHESFHFFCDVTGVARDDVGIPGLAEEMLCDAFADFMTENFNVAPKERK